MAYTAEVYPVKGVRFNNDFKNRNIPLIELTLHIEDILTFRFTNSTFLYRIVFICCMPTTCRDVLIQSLFSQNESEGNRVAADYWDEDPI